MAKRKWLSTATILFILLISVCGNGRTWRLDEGQQWQELSKNRQDAYYYCVARIKQLVNAGRCSEVRSEFEKLQEDFPEVAGIELKSFMAAENLYCSNSFGKAIGAYRIFMETFPQSELFEAALEREYDIGTAYLRGRRKKILGLIRVRAYSDGIEIMEDITERAGDTPLGVKAQRAIAEHYEEHGQYEDAYAKWSVIHSRWPVGETGQDSLLGMARCKHAAFRGADYDASHLLSAVSYYERFQSRYPEAAKELGIAEKISQAKEQYAYTQFWTGRFYMRSGDVQAANIYFQMVVDNWPESAAAKMSRAALAKGESIFREKGWKREAFEKFEELLL